MSNNDALRETLQYFLDHGFDREMCINALADIKPEPRCVICGSDEPFSGTCGSPDARALCNKVSKPEPQAQAGEPEVVAWALGNPRYVHQSNILPAHEFNPDAEHEDEWTALITLQSHREAMAAKQATLDRYKRLLDEAYLEESDLRIAGAKKDAALKVCVEALKRKRTYQSADGVWHDTWDGDLVDAAIQQAKEARGS